MTLTQLGLKNSLTQEECAKIAGVSRRTYQTYETIKDYFENDKYNFIYNKIYTSCHCEEDLKFYGKVQYKADTKINDDLKMYTSSVLSFKKRRII